MLLPSKKLKLESELHTAHLKLEFSLNTTTQLRMH